MIAALINVIQTVYKLSLMLTGWSSAVERSRCDVRTVLNKQLQHRYLLHIVSVLR